MVLFWFHFFITIYKNPNYNEWEKIQVVFAVCNLVIYKKNSSIYIGKEETEFTIYWNSVFFMSDPKKIHLEIFGCIMFEEYWKKKYLGSLFKMYFACLTFLGQIFDRIWHTSQVKWFCRKYRHLISWDKRRRPFFLFFFNIKTCFVYFHLILLSFLIKSLGTNWSKLVI